MRKVQVHSNAVCGAAPGLYREDDLLPSVQYDISMGRAEYVEVQDTVIEPVAPEVVVSTSVVEIVNPVVQVVDTIVPEVKVDMAKMADTTGVTITDPAGVQQDDPISELVESGAEQTEQPVAPLEPRGDDDVVDPDHDPVEPKRPKGTVKVSVKSKPKSKQKARR